MSQADSQAAQRDATARQLHIDTPTAGYKSVSRDLKGLGLWLGQCPTGRDAILSLDRATARIAALAFRMKERARARGLDRVGRCIFYLCHSHWALTSRTETEVDVRGSTPRRR